MPAVSGALNDSRYEPGLAMFAPDAELTFPGDNTWSRQHRPPQAGRDPYPTHRGRAEVEDFLRRYVEHHIHMEVEDILVNGPPWNTRAAVRVHHWIAGPDGKDLYANRAVLIVRTSWGKIRTQEDTSWARSAPKKTTKTPERVAAFDAASSTSSA